MFRIKTKLSSGNMVGPEAIIISMEGTRSRLHSSASRNMAAMIPQRSRASKIIVFLAVLDDSRRSFDGAGRIQD